MKNCRSARVLTAALLGVMIVPIATQDVLQGSIVREEGNYAIFRSIDDDGMNFNGEDIRQDVLNYQTTLRAQRRAYTRAVERCRDRRRDGEDIECPEFNDPDSYGVEVEEPVHAAAKEPEVRSAPSSRTLIRKLSNSERELLRTYTRAGFCSGTLSEYLYALCRSIVGDEDVEMPTGIINDNVYLHSRYATPRPTLKLRLQMMNEAISGSRGRRTDLRMPLRYQGGLNR